MDFHMPNTNEVKKTHRLGDSVSQFKNSQDQIRVSKRKSVMSSKSSNRMLKVSKEQMSVLSGTDKSANQPSKPESAAGGDKSPGLLHSKTRKFEAVKPAEPAYPQTALKMTIEE